MRGHFCTMKTHKPKRIDEKLSELIIVRMKELRSIYGFSQEDLIEHTGLDIFHFENGSKKPTTISLSILCEFYNITLGEFFTPLNYPPKK